LSSSSAFVAPDRTARFDGCFLLFRAPLQEKAFPTVLFAVVARENIIFIHNVE
jgi:hypothetical protein